MSFIATRRLGERHAVQGVVVDWNTQGRRQPKWRRPFADADVVDVSVSGAMFLAPHDPSLRPGSIVTWHADGSLGTGVIRRISEVTNRKLCVIGVEFTELEPGMEALLFATIHAGSKSISDRAWY